MNEPAIASCRICGERLENYINCARCSTPAHKDCFDYNEQCPVFACGEKTYRAGQPFEMKEFVIIDGKPPKNLTELIAADPKARALVNSFEKNVNLVWKRYMDETAFPPVVISVLGFCISFHLTDRANDFSEFLMFYSYAMGFSIFTTLTCCKIYNSTKTYIDDKKRLYQRLQTQLESLLEN